MKILVSTCAYHGHNWELLIERSLPGDNIQADARLPPTQSSLAHLEKYSMCLFCSSFPFDQTWPWCSDLGCCGVRSRDEADGTKFCLRLQDLSQTCPWTRGAPWNTHHHSLGLGRRKLLVLLPKWWKQLAFASYRERPSESNNVDMKKTPRIIPLPYNRPLSWRRQSLKSVTSSKSSQVTCKLPFGDNTPLFLSELSSWCTPACLHTLE